MTPNQEAIVLTNVSKKYKLFSSVQDRLKESLLFNKQKYHQEFWAIKDINLAIPKGHTIGIVGRNGSGKSTLLKLISSVVKPTSGQITVHGKIAALLELGTGFNPDFTGLQNIALSCTLMGLSTQQINERMTEIQEFADIGDFINHPLRTYSSGMRTRLAFATAINVNPDILIVDEALAVGDARFQQKCYQKFLNFQQSGKTILLVTHDMHVIPRYCNLAILLEAGQVISVGEPKKIVSMYSELLLCGHISSVSDKKNIQHTPDSEITVSTKENQKTADNLSSTKKEIVAFIANNSFDESIYNNVLYNKNEYRFGNGKATIIDALIVAENICNPSIITSGTNVDVYLKILANEDILEPLVGVSIKTRDGILVYAINTRFLKLDVQSVHQGEIKTYKFSLALDLAPGDWFLDLGIAEKQFTEDPPCDIRNNSIHVQVIRRNYFDGLVELDTLFEEMT